MGRKEVEAKRSEDEGEKKKKKRKEKHPESEEGEKKKKRTEDEVDKKRTKEASEEPALDERAQRIADKFEKKKKKFEEGEGNNPKDYFFEGKFDFETWRLMQKVSKKDRTFEAMGAEHWEKRYERYPEVLQALKAQHPHGTKFMDLDKVKLLKLQAEWLDETNQPKTEDLSKLLNNAHAAELGCFGGWMYPFADDSEDSDSDVESINSEKFYGEGDNQKMGKFVLEEEADAADARVKRLTTKLKEATARKSARSSKKIGDGKKTGCKGRPKIDVYEKFKLFNRGTMSLQNWQNYCVETGKNKFTPLKFTGANGLPYYKKMIVADDGENGQKLIFARITNEEIEKTLNDGEEGVDWF